MLKRGALVAAVFAAYLATLVPQANASVASADTCDGNAGYSGATCIDVQGSGLRVDSISTTLQRYQHSGCYSPVITVNGAVNLRGPSVCAGPKWSYGPVRYGYNFPNNARVCAYWSYNPDVKACITVHS